MRRTMRSMTNLKPTKMASHSNVPLDNRQENQENTTIMVLSDCVCPICLYILIEPVTMPCRHELCMSCFKQNVQEASLTCPMCRMRISTWARRAARNNKLIDQSRWSAIKQAFPRKVQMRLDGIEDESSSDEDQQVVIPLIAEPGEIRKEYEAEMQKLQEERDLLYQEEVQRSKDLIVKLQMEEEEHHLQAQEQRLHDERLAKELEDALNASSNVLETPEIGNFLERRRLASETEGTPRSGRQSNPLMERFLERGRKDTGQQKKPDDKYPYTCISPWEKVDNESKRKTEKERPPSHYSDIFSQTAEDRPNSYNSAASTVSYVYVDSRSNSRQAGSVPLEDKKPDLVEISSPDVMLISPDVEGNESANKVNPVTGVDVDAELTEYNRSPSRDSISQEMSHFKPIRLCPRTPPRKLPSGKVCKPPLVRSTPINGSHMAPQARLDTLSPDGAVGSPIMHRQLLALEAERQAQVQALSKGTCTEGKPKPTHMGSQTAMQDHTYGSPSASSSSAHTGRVTLAKTTLRDICKKKSAAATVSRHDSPEEDRSTARRLTFDIDPGPNSEVAVHVTSADAEPPDKQKHILPLVSNLESPPLLPILPLVSNLDCSPPTIFPLESNIGTTSPIPMSGIMGDVPVLPVLPSDNLLEEEPPLPTPPAVLLSSNLTVSPRSTHSKEASPSQATGVKAGNNGKGQGVASSSPANILCDLTKNTVAGVEEPARSSGSGRIYAMKGRLALRNPVGGSPALRTPVSGSPASQQATTSPSSRASSRHSTGHKKARQEGNVTDVSPAASDNGRDIQRNEATRSGSSASGQSGRNSKAETKNKQGSLQAWIQASTKPSLIQITSPLMAVSTTHEGSLPGAVPRSPPPVQTSGDGSGDHSTNPTATTEGTTQVLSGGVSGSGPIVITTLLTPHTLDRRKARVAQQNYLPETPMMVRAINKASVVPSSILDAGASTSAQVPGISAKTSTIGGWISPFKDKLKGVYKYFQGAGGDNVIQDTRTINTSNADLSSDAGDDGSTVISSSPVPVDRCVGNKPVEIPPDPHMNQIVTDSPYNVIVNECHRQLGVQDELLQVSSDFSSPEKSPRKKPTHCKQSRTRRKRVQSESDGENASSTVKVAEGSSGVGLTTGSGKTPVKGKRTPFLVPLCGNESESEKEGAAGPSTPRRGRKVSRAPVARPLVVPQCADRKLDDTHSEQAQTSLVNSTTECADLPQNSTQTSQTEPKTTPKASSTSRQTPRKPKVCRNTPKKSSRNTPKKSVEVHDTPKKPGSLTPRTSGGDGFKKSSSHKASVGSLILDSEDSDGEVFFKPLKAHTLRKHVPEMSEATTTEEESDAGTPMKRPRRERRKPKKLQDAAPSTKVVRQNGNLRQPTATDVVLNQAHDVSPAGARPVRRQLMAEENRSAAQQRENTAHQQENTTNTTQMELLSEALTKKSAPSKRGRNTGTASTSPEHTPTKRARKSKPSGSIQDPMDGDNSLPVIASPRKRGQANASALSRLISETDSDMSPQKQRQSKVGLSRVARQTGSSLDDSASGPISPNVKSPGKCTKVRDRTKGKNVKKTFTLRSRVVDGDIISSEGIQRISQPDDTEGSDDESLPQRRGLRQQQDKCITAKHSADCKLMEDKENSRDNSFEDEISQSGKRAGASKSSLANKEVVHKLLPQKTRKLKYIEYSPDGLGKKLCAPRRSHRNGPQDTKHTRQTKLFFSSCDDDFEESPAVVKPRKSSKSSKPVSKNKVKGQQLQLQVSHGGGLCTSRRGSVDSDTRAHTRGCDADSEGMGEAPDERRRERSSFSSEAAYQHYIEEQDRLLALRLQADFDLENKLNLTAIRRKGSDGEYSLRRSNRAGHKGFYEEV